jgi:hypothetical protein
MSVAGTTSLVLNRFLIWCLCPNPRMGPGRAEHRRHVELPADLVAGRACWRQHNRLTPPSGGRTYATHYNAQRPSSRPRSEDAGSASRSPFLRRPTASASAGGTCWVGLSNEYQLGA